MAVLTGVIWYGYYYWFGQSASIIECDADCQTDQAIAAATDKTGSLQSALDLCPKSADGKPESSCASKVKQTKLSKPKFADVYQAIGKCEDEIDKDYSGCVDAALTKCGGDAKCETALKGKSKAQLHDLLTRVQGKAEFQVHKSCDVFDTKEFEAARKAARKICKHKELSEAAKGKCITAVDEAADAVHLPHLKRNAFAKSGQAVHKCENDYLNSQRVDKKTFNSCIENAKGLCNIDGVTYNKSECHKKADDLSKKYRKEAAGPPTVDKKADPSKKSSRADETGIESDKSSWNPISTIWDAPAPGPQTIQSKPTDPAADAKKTPVAAPPKASPGSKSTTPKASETESLLGKVLTQADVRKKVRKCEDDGETLFSHSYLWGGQYSSCAQDAFKSCGDNPKCLKLRKMKRRSSKSG